MKRLNLKSGIKKVFFALVIFTTSLSCKKETIDPFSFSKQARPTLAKSHAVSRGYSDHFITTFTATNFKFADGFNLPPTSADFPGGGFGNASHVGKAQTRFNSHITFATLLQVPVHLYSHPPFRLELRDFHLPSTMVNSIVYDHQRNSIWFAAVGGSAAYTDATHTVVAFTVRTNIVGGTGKFQEQQEILN